MAAEKDFIERRKHKRRSLYCLIRYRPHRKDLPLQSIITSIRNISGGGVYFKSGESLPGDTILDIEISLPSINRIVSATARVVRFEKLKDANSYGIGAMFVDIKEQDRQAIINIAST